MPVSRNKRKDGKRHKIKHRPLSKAEIILAGLIKAGKIKVEPVETINANKVSEGQGPPATE